MQITEFNAEISENAPLNLQKISIYLLKQKSLSINKPLNKAVKWAYSVINKLGMIEMVELRGFEPLSKVGAT